MRETHDKIAAGLEDALDIVEHLVPIDPAVAEAIGQSMARIMGFDTYKTFEAGAATDASESDRDVRRACIDDGLFILRYLRTIGFDIVKLENPHA